MGVPLLDVSQLHAGPHERKRYLQDLMESFKMFGFVRLKNHGISEARVNQMLELARELFELDGKSKMELSDIADGSPQRGYSAMGVEKTASVYSKLLGFQANKNLTDAREHFDFGSPLDKQFVNRWPETLDRFRLEVESFYFELERAAAEILSCLEEGLGCPEGSFNGLVTHDNNASELRFNHYPPVPASILREGQVSRIWPHFDLGVITLLFTSPVGGLEVEDRTFPAGRAFIPVVPDADGELIVNISETLQRWTDDQLPAGLHRVSIPKQLGDETDADPETEIPRRYSIAYLCKADRQAPVGSMPVFQVGQTPRYSDTTAAEYHRARILDAY